MPFVEQELGKIQQVTSEMMPRWACEIAQQVEVIATEPDELTDPRDPCCRGRDLISADYSLIFTFCAVAYT